MFQVVLGSLILLLSSANTRAEAPVRVGCNASVPPYVLLHSGSGIILDQIRQALQNVGLSLELSPISNSDNLALFRNKQLDMLCFTTPEASPNGYFSAHPLVSFHNTAISLKDSKIEIRSYQDLKSYSIMAFNMAHQLLPDEFAQTLLGQANYLELANQQHQVEALFKGAADIVIMEKTVFRYYLSQLRRANPSNLDLRQAYVYSDFFSPVTYYPAFANAKLRDQYDQGFKMLIESGEDKRISNRYYQLLDSYLFTHPATF